MTQLLQNFARLIMVKILLYTYNLKFYLELLADTAFLSFHTFRQGFGKFKTLQTCQTTFATLWLKIER